MTIFSKPKRPAPTPGVCERCRQRPGVSYFSLTELSPTGRALPSSRPAWICQSCVEEVGRDAPRN